MSDPLLKGLEYSFTWKLVSVNIAFKIGLHIQINFFYLKPFKIAQYVTLISAMGEQETKIMLEISAKYLFS